MSATLNGVRVVSARLVIPFTGAWFADCDLDPNDATQPITGAATLSLLGTTLTGTIDPRASGRFIAGYKVRVVAGAGGWDKLVSRTAYHNDAGVTSTQVYQAAAQAVGETVNDPNPVAYNADFVQFGAGAARQVFRDRNYYVDTSGITHVADWPAATPDPSVTVLEFNAETLELQASTDALIFPNTAFTDTRFDGTLIARDVEIMVGPEGGRATIWCSSSSVTRLVSALTNMTRAFAGTAKLRSYRYRVIQQNSDGRLLLQAVNPGLGAPDLGPISVWPGMQGDSAIVQLSSECEVEFQEQDPSLPVVVAWSPLGMPTKRTVDASAQVNVGPSAPVVQLAGGANPLAYKAALSSAISALNSFANGVSTATPPTTLATVLTFCTDLQGFATSLATALSAITPLGTTKTGAA